MFLLHDWIVLRISSLSAFGAVFLLLFYFCVRLPLPCPLWYAYTAMISVVCVFGYVIICACMRPVVSWVRGVWIVGVIV